MLKNEMEFQIHACINREGSLTLQDRWRVLQWLVRSWRLLIGLKCAL